MPIAFLVSTQKRGEERTEKQVLGSSDGNEARRDSGKGFQKATLIPHLPSAGAINFARCAFCSLRVKLMMLCTTWIYDNGTSDRNSLVCETLFFRSENVHLASHEAELNWRQCAITYGARGSQHVVTSAHNFIISCVFSESRHLLGPFFSGYDNVIPCLEGFPLSLVTIRPEQTQISFLRKAEIHAK